jgi:hypothetical protein
MGPVATPQAPAAGVLLSGGSTSTFDVAAVVGGFDGFGDGAAVERALVGGIVVAVLEVRQPAMSTRAKARVAGWRRSTRTSCRRPGGSPHCRGRASRVWTAAYPLGGSREEASDGDRAGLGGSSDNGTGSFAIGPGSSFTYGYMDGMQLFHVSHRHRTPHPRRYLYRNSRWEPGMVAGIGHDLHHGSHTPARRSRRFWGSS